MAAIVTSATLTPAFLCFCLSSVQFEAEAHGDHIKGFRISPKQQKDPGPQRKLSLGPI